MKKTFIILTLILAGTAIAHAQNILPGYDGILSRDYKINILDLVPYYPDELGVLRNEIYARYGRPFATQIYRDHFKNQEWYREKNDFSDSWLSETDRENADFILSVEKSIRRLEDATNQVLRNIEYTDGTAVLAFTSFNNAMWIDRRVDFGFYGMSGSYRQIVEWFVMGDWYIVFEENFFDGGYFLAAYQLDHSTRRIINTAEKAVRKESFGETQFIWKLDDLLRSQGRID